MVLSLLTAVLTAILFGNLFANANLSIFSIQDTFSLLSHNTFPDHAVRIKQSHFCDSSVRVFTGYVDFNAKHLFFYFFESRHDPKNDPVVLWVNGGPGASASLGMLMELGPCTIDGPNGTRYNPYGWNDRANTIFLDQPVGVGYSYADYGQTISTTEDAAIDVAAFLAILWNSLDEFRGKDLHLAGESFGGRYIPLFAAAVYDQNELLKQSGMETLNLKSIMIGNGVSEWKYMFEGYYTMQCTNASGLGAMQTISTCVRMKQALPRCQKLMETHCQPPFDGMNCEFAMNFCRTEIEEPFNTIERNAYDMRTECYGDIFETLCFKEVPDIAAYLNNPSTRKTLGIPISASNITYSPIGWEVNSAFGVSGDSNQPSTGHIAALLNRDVRVLLYLGKQDYSCNWVGNLRMAKELEWEGQSGFVQAAEAAWESQGVVSGWMKSFGGLSFVVVEGAGHMVPHDQPAVALDLVNKWLRNEGFN